MPLTSGEEKRNIYLPFLPAMVNSSAQPRKAACLLLLVAPALVPMRFLANRSSRTIAVLLLQAADKKNDVFDILWILVFGFATLNILSLVTRRFEPNRNRISFGESLAIMVVVVSVGLLGWELLTVFKIFPIRLHPR